MKSLKSIKVSIIMVSFHKYVHYIELYGIELYGHGTKNDRSFGLFTSSPGLSFGSYSTGVEEVVGMWYGCCNVVAKYGLSV